MTRTLRRSGLTIAAGLLVFLALHSATRADDAASPLAALRAYAEGPDMAEEASAAAPEAAAPHAEPAPEATGSLQKEGLGSARERMLPLIEKAAREHNLPPSLVEAVVRVESRYNPNVQNAGAIGLMQIKLATARGLGFAGDAAALKRPETNLHWGAKYLARAYSLSHGDTCLTLARYQGGHRIERMGPAGKAYCAKVRTVLAQRD